MPRKIAPSEAKAQEVLALLQGQSEAHSGEELLGALVRLLTERVLQEALERSRKKCSGTVGMNGVTTWPGDKARLEAFVRTIQIDTLQKNYMEVHVAIDDTAKALEQCHRPRMCLFAVDAAFDCLEGYSQYNAIHHIITPPSVKPGVR